MDEFPPALGIWQTVLFNQLQHGIPVDEAVLAADLALAAYKKNFETPA